VITATQTVEQRIVNDKHLGHTLYTDVVLSVAVFTTALDTDNLHKKC